MEVDLGFGFLLFRGTLPPELLSLRSGLGPCRGYSVRRCLLVFPYPITPDAKFRCLTLHLRRLLLSYPNNHY